MSERRDGQIEITSISITTVTTKLYLKRCDKINGVIVKSCEVIKPTHQSEWTDRAYECIITASFRAAQGGAGKCE